MTRRRLLVLIVLPVLTGGLCWWKFAGRGKQTDALRELRVVRGDIELSVLTTGDVRPRNRLELKPPLPGRVEDILVREGDGVTKGQILAWMSSSDRAALLDAARAKGPAELARWEDLYKPAPLVSPLSGRVIARNVEPGQTVASSDAVLVLSDRLIVKAQVDETDMAQIRLGQPARVVLDAFADAPLAATVEHIAFESKTVSNVTIYEVDVLPRDPPPYLRSGMTANVTFHVDEKKGVLLLPAVAVKIGEPAEVLVPAGKGKPQTRTVKTGLSNGKMIEIRSGLAEGDTVLVDDGLPASTVKTQTSPLSPMMRRPGRRAR